MHVIFFPGQGAQFRGMGRDLFKQYPSLTSQASDILGYSIEALCVDDPDNQLNKTQFTQPALYVTNALAYYAWLESGPVKKVDYFAGHSLGEYNALLAANAFSFEDGLRLVQLRGQLMGEASGGGMAAVLGVRAERIRTMLDEGGLGNVELVNFNSPTQTVISGLSADIAAAERLFTQAGVRCVVLNVSAAFHSRYMRAAQEVFMQRIQERPLRHPSTPVIANLTGLPYEKGQTVQTLGMQISSPVKWMDSVIYLLAQGDLRYTEIGSTILTKLSDEIRTACTSEIEQMKRARVTPPASTPAMPVAEKYFQPW